jgi:hypothetical protein
MFFDAGVGGAAGVGFASQKPIAAKHAQAVLSGSQHEGHFFPGV